MAFGLGKNTKDTKKKDIKKPSRAAGETGRRMTRRMIAFGSIVAGLSVLLIGRLFVLQITDYEKYQSKVISQLTRETTTTPERGKIYDTNMNLLATNTTVYRVAISPYDIAGGDEVFKNISDEDMDAAVASLTLDAANNQKAQIIARKCEEMFGVSYDTTMQKAAKVRRRDETITKNVDPDVAAELRTFIQENELQGMLNLYAESKRYYCYGDLACHVIGFTNSDGNGVYGVEATYNEYLKGTNGKYITAKDSVGKSMPFKYESYINAENGANLVVTIDLKIQYDLETQVQAAYDSAQAGNRVCGIAMDPNTGAILAMAVYPNYDLNSPYELAEEFLTQLNDSGYAEDSDEYSELKSDLIFEMWNNKCVSETYEPGSTFKILTAAAALEEGAVKVDDTFYCPGWYLGEGFSQPISCHRTAGHGTVTFARGLQQSCNPTLMMTAERLGLDKFYKYFEAFGYTGKTGVDLPGEVYGIYHDKSEMHPTELAVYSFGQTFKATPLQQLTAICSVANGGYLVTPHVLKEMVDDDGNTIYTYETEKKIQVLSEDTCKTVTDILTEGVATDGGAKNAYVKGYNVAAKTGTSQKQDKWVYTYDEEGNVIDAQRPFRVGSTVAFAPSEDPQIAVLLVVDEPTGVSYGSTVAAPYISKFLAQVLPYMGCEAQYSEEDLKNTEVTIATLVGLDTESACHWITNRQMQYKIIGDGKEVVQSVPAVGARIQKESGIVYLYTGTATPSDTKTVPNLIGLTAAQANYQITARRLNVRIEGAQNYDQGSSAVVVAQSPAEGTMVSPGTVITIELRHMDGTD